MINIPKGTKDVLPKESYKWHYIEEKLRRITQLRGALEIRNPIFEHTELFIRGVGETTDIVNKEMYTFIDKGDRSITLKPEGTAGVVRCFIENNLANEPMPLKMYYFTPVFRYEKPQSGRLREHHQFGVEFYGSDEPISDVEVILTAKQVFEDLKIENVELNINSIGCPICRKEYNTALRAFFADNIDKMCPVCKDRLDKNPLRILDCKEDACIKINKNAPLVLDYLCSDCKKHHEEVCRILTELNVNFKVNPRIVRGLDYYTKTVFEFVTTTIGAQGTVCGGGRYNNFVESLGGKSTPAIGFGMGIERLILVMENANQSIGEPQVPTVYIAPLGENQALEGYKLVRELRDSGISADTDFMKRSLKASMKYANKQGYNYVIVVGEDEVTNGKYEIKNMLNGETTQVDKSQLIAYFTNK